MSSVTINNIQAIKDLTIDLPDDRGGVLVLKGKNRAGKSTAIAVLRALLAGSGRFKARDHAPKGKAEGFGKSVNVSSSTRHTGELSVPSIEGKFDFSDLVHPAGKTADTRDAARIKALVSLTGVEARPELFYDLVGGKEAFEGMVSPDALKTDDLVEMASKVHAAFHSAARKLEDQASHEEGHANACKESAGGVARSDTEVDPAELQLALEASIGKLHSKRQTRDVAVESAKRSEELQQRIAAAQQKGVADVDYCKTQLELANVGEENLAKEVSAMEEELEALKAKYAQARSDANMLKAKLDHAIETRDQIMAWSEEIVAAGQMPNPSDSEIQEAELAVTRHRRAIEELAVRRERLIKLSQSEGHAILAKEFRSRAVSLREAAKSVDNVLSASLPPGPLRAESGRLVLNTERGEGVPFDECSDGEKWKVALPYGIQGLEQGGVLPVVQDAWQDLDNTNRDSVARACDEHKVWIITGEVADGDLRVEEYNRVGDKTECPSSTSSES